MVETLVLATTKSASSVLYWDLVRTSRPHGDKCLVLMRLNVISEVVLRLGMNWSWTG